MHVNSAWFIGEGSLLVQAAEIWRELGHGIAGVASEDPGIVAWAERQGVRRVRATELQLTAAEQPFDYLFSLVNLRMLEPALLQLARRLAVNFHDGPLPRYAGVNAPVWALLHGEREHGVTLHVMEAGADEGDILVQRSCAIAPDESAFSLNAKCFSLGIECFRELAQAITQGTLQRRAQPLAARSYFGFYERPHQLLLDLREPAEQLERAVRALDFGSYPNPVGLPKLLLPGGGAVIVGRARVGEARSQLAPGTIVRESAGALVIATSTQDLELGALRHPAGGELEATEHAALQLLAGTRLPCPSEELSASHARHSLAAARSEGYCVRTLREAVAIELPVSRSERQAQRACAVVKVNEVEPAQLAALLLAFLARRSGARELYLDHASPALRAAAEAAPGCFASELPLRVALPEAASIAQAMRASERALSAAQERTPPSSDLRLRRPELRDARLDVALLDGVTPAADASHTLTFVIDRGRRQIELWSSCSPQEAPQLERLAEQLGQFARRAAAEPAAPLARVPLASARDLERLAQINATQGAYAEHTCIHALFSSCAAQRGSERAVSAGSETLSYEQLERRANALAHALVALGVGPDRRVGIYLGRSVHLPVAVLAVLKAGGAYVPLDPQYPRERIELMIDDAELCAVLTDRASAPSLPRRGIATLDVDSEAFASGRELAPASEVQSEHLAYVIYTSGSTGKPKGVMVEHRNVLNFFAAMDRVLGSERGTWLAVTSLSFDISVLELLWTLTRGFHVVIQEGHNAASRAQPARKLDFSLFYFASQSAGADQYRLLLEGARFADAHGFSAVWTPERHFHAFGGLYPNPSVASAALAMITERVALRAGSCVSPLHSPIRIAEEWALVDNLSRGRVGISFAAGWQPNDFCIQPADYARRKERMFEDIETVRKLWRGESVEFANGQGERVAISTLPRPVQQELPVWVTAAGNPETFEAAGRAGANLLTHLLGQSLEEVRDKIRVYRAAYAAAGHAGRGSVTLMLHSCVGADDAQIKALVREPMKGYLRSAVGLIEAAAWSFPTFKQRLDAGSFSASQLSHEELDALLEHAFERYYSDSGLFGSLATARAAVERVRASDVDEIACLIDFGMPSERVLEQLPFLAQLVAAEQQVAPRTAAPAPSLAELVQAHAVTHFQCTPSMANLLLLDERDAEALGQLTHMLVGGEALSPVLAAQLRARLSRGTLVNVYGPTETTVWSTAHVVQELGADVPLGAPLLNTELFILDAAGQLAPLGERGELIIGGKGVTRGYLARPELTQERFVTHPLRSDERAYRTGDLASFDSDGTLHFHGRIDHQVKVSGYRIELGEIEARLQEHTGVRECAVVVRADEASGTPRLVCFVVAKQGRLGADELRAHLRERLPEHMVPATFVSLDALPKTPNRKLDRNALPAATSVQPSARKLAADALPQGELEELIAAEWREVLGLPAVGVSENFFAIGGHSLLTIQLLGRLKTKLERPLLLVDLFRFPTIRALAQHLAGEAAGGGLEASAARGVERGRIRRAMLSGRR